MDHRSLLLEQASIVHSCIQNALQANEPENYCDGLIPPPESLSLQDCDIPDSVDDPLQIVRHVRGEARAQWLEYEDDLETIAQEIEECSAEIRRGLLIPAAQ
jgi:hypothetical protein